MPHDPRLRRIRNIGLIALSTLLIPIIWTNLILSQAQQRGQAEWDAMIAAEPTDPAQQDQKDQAEKFMSTLTLAGVNESNLIANFYEQNAYDADYKFTGGTTETSLCPVGDLVDHCRVAVSTTKFPEQVDLQICKDFLAYGKSYGGAALVESGSGKQIKLSKSSVNQCVTGLNDYVSLPGIQRSHEVYLIGTSSDGTPFAMTLRKLFRQSDNYLEYDFVAGTTFQGGSPNPN